MPAHHAQVYEDNLWVLAGRCQEGSLLGHCHCLQRGGHDPAEQMVCRIVKEWLLAWCSLGPLQSMVRRAWPSILLDIEQGKKGAAAWARVRGPAADVVLTLKPFGWRILAPDRWALGEDEEWALQDVCLNLGLGDLSPSWWQ